MPSKPQRDYRWAMQSEGTLEFARVIGQDQHGQLVTIAEGVPSYHACELVQAHNAWVRQLAAELARTERTG